MVCKPGVMHQIIREGMDDYWRVIHAKSDEGLSATEISWRRDHERSMVRMEEKFGSAYAKFFRDNR